MDPGRLGICLGSRVHPLSLFLRGGKRSKSIHGPLGAMFSGHYSQKQAPRSARRLPLLQSFFAKRNQSSSPDAWAMDLVSSKTRLRTFGSSIL